jgi:hypothetical protein
VVHAIDVDRDRIDPTALVKRAIRHPTVHYVIFNRTISTRDNNFRTQRYTGDNPHTGYVHVSRRRGSTYENDRTPVGHHHRSDPAGTDAPSGRVHRIAHPTAGQPAPERADMPFAQRFIGERQCGAVDGFHGPRTETGVPW